MSETSIPNLVAQIEQHAPGETLPTVPVLNPFTGKRILELPQLSAEQVGRAAETARAASAEWAATPVSERAGILLKIHDVLLANQDKLLDVLQLETGKSRAHAFEEFSGTIQGARYYGKVSPKLLRRTKTRAGVPGLTKTWVERVPVGLVGIVTPWNYPMALTALDVFPALAAGNSVLQKADNQTALSVLILRQFAISAGLPEGVWQIVTGDGQKVGNAVTDLVDYMAFTGSTATGRRVYERAAARLIGVSLELGGKNPMIVLPGAKPKRAAAIAIGGAFGSAGQLCVSIERVYVHESIFDDFVAELAKQTEALTVGKSSKFDFDLGTLISKAQLDRVNGLVEEAKQDGAHVIAGGQPLPEVGPFAYAPTVLTDLPAKTRMFRQEAFGPILAVSPYSEIEDAIAAANDTEYGLNAAVVGPTREAIAVARQLHAGSVNVNEGYRASFASMDSPMGGMKASGIGRRNGAVGLQRFTLAKTIGVASSALKLPNNAREWRRMQPAFKVLLKIFRWF